MVLDPVYAQQLSMAYGWETDTTFTLLQNGENATYRVTAGGSSYALRQYRPGRYNRAQVEGELAWVEALHGTVAVPALVRNRRGERATLLADAPAGGGPATAVESAPLGGQLCSVFAFVEGQEPDQTDRSFDRRLGAVARRLHDASDAILAASASDWAGHHRPAYDRATLIEQPLAQLLAATCLTPDDRRRAERAAAAMLPAVGSLPTGFIHNDLHAGNLLAAGDDLVCLDFDECGFGPRALDLGVIRMHLIARGALERWPEVAEGYGGFPEEEARLGTALRTFWMAAKVLGRPDVVTDPEVRIPRYLGWVERELFSF